MRLDGYYGLGGGQFDYEEHVPGSSVGNRSPEANLRCLETEGGVAFLKIDRRTRGIGECVLLHYRDHPAWSAQIQADFLRLSVRTLWRRLEDGHTLLLGYFLDCSVGLKPQTEELRLERRARAIEA